MVHDAFPSFPPNKKKISPLTNGHDGPTRPGYIYIYSSCAYVYICSLALVRLLECPVCTALFCHGCIAIDSRLSFIRYYVEYHMLIHIGTKPVATIHGRLLGQSKGGILQVLLTRPLPFSGYTSVSPLFGHLCLWSRPQPILLLCRCFLRPAGSCVVADRPHGVLPM